MKNAAMRLGLLAIVAGTFLGTANGSVVAVVSTGLDGSGNLITTGGVTDPHWTSTIDPVYDPSGTTQTTYPNNADWYSGWVANGPNSTWITRNANKTDNGPAPYSFSTTFSLAGYDVTTASLKGAWTLDDKGTLYLNGTLLDTRNGNEWNALHPFSASSSAFVAGVNTLTMTLTYSDQFLEAMRLEGTVTANPFVSTVPEPATIASAAVAALIGLGIARRRRTA